LTAARLGLILAATLLAACSSRSDRGAPARIERLQAEHRDLHKRFEKAAATEPLVTSAFSDRGQVILAIRSGLIEELAGNVAARYLDRVVVDLGNISARSSGEMNKKTFLGEMKLGEWNVRVELGTLSGHLRAGQPRVGLRPPDLIDIDLPVDVEETVCKDFQTTQVIKGRVLPQRHLLSGALQLRNIGGRLTETPLFPNRKLQVRMDLTGESWADLERALRAEDTVDKCGMFMKPSDGLDFLKELAARGIAVRLPDSIFRAVDLPARLQESVQVNQRPIGLQITAESLRIDTATLWSSVTVQVQTRPRP